MIAPLVLALSTAVLPQGEATYRMELAGVHVGQGTLAIGCAGEDCTATWTTRVRLPDEAGGEVAGGRVALVVGPDGRSRGGPARVERDGVSRDVPGRAGAVPAMIAPAVLLAAAEDRCVDAYEEETGLRGRACGRRRGRAVEATILGETYRLARSDDGLPSAIELPAQRTRWIRAPGPAMPSAAPRLMGTRVEGGPRATRFCGLGLDVASPAPPASFPPAEGRGASCREVALDYVLHARDGGLEGRIAVGVAWTGEAFACHAGAEVRDGDPWIAVDPTFRQLPARGPRFTVARYAPDDPAGRLAAGRRVLACWGERAR